MIKNIIIVILILCLVITSGFVFNLKSILYPNSEITEIQKEIGNIKKEIQNAWKTAFEYSVEKIDMYNKKQLETNIDNKHPHNNKVYINKIEKIEKIDKKLKSQNEDKSKSTKLINKKPIECKQNLFNKKELMSLLSILNDADKLLNDSVSTFDKQVEKKQEKKSYNKKKLSQQLLNGQKKQE